MAQALALSVIPLDELGDRAERAAVLSRQMEEHPPLDEVDALAEELLLWFKRDFFAWVRRPVKDRWQGGGCVGERGV